MQTEIFIFPYSVVKFIEYCRSSKSGQLSPTSIKKNMTDEMREYFSHSSLSVREINFMLKVGMNKLPVCKTCGKVIHDFIQPHWKVKTYCNTACSNASEEVKKKKEEVFLKKYGVTNPLKNSEIRESIKQNNLEKYGVENVSQSSIVKDKRIQTFLERYGEINPSKVDSVKEKKKETLREHYGVESPLQSQEIKEKMRRTMMEKYGCENYTQFEEYKKKARQTSLEKYGCENYNQTQESKERHKKTNLEKYGVPCNLMCEDTKEKIKKTNLERYGAEYPQQNKEILEKSKETNLKKYGAEYLITLEENKKKTVQSRRNLIYESFLERCKDRNLQLLSAKDEYINAKDSLKMKCLSCGEEFQSLSTNFQEIFCPNCKRQAWSIDEKKLFNIVKSLYSGNIIENDRSVLNGKELDLYIPEKNLAIEYNGNFWHSDYDKKTDYHQEKSMMCLKKGITLLHIFEYNTLDEDFLVQYISSFLNDKRKADLKNCSIVEIDNDLAKYFIENNVMESVKLDDESIYGIFENEDLLCVFYIKGGICYPYVKMDVDEENLLSFIREYYNDISFSFNVTHGFNTKLLDNYIILRNTNPNCICVSKDNRILESIANSTDMRIYDSGSIILK